MDNRLFLREKQLLRECVKETANSEVIFVIPEWYYSKYLSLNTTSSTAEILTKLTRIFKKSVNLAQRVSADDSITFMLSQNSYAPFSSAFVEYLRALGFNSYFSEDLDPEPYSTAVAYAFIKDPNFITHSDTFTIIKSEQIESEKIE